MAINDSKAQVIFTRHFLPSQGVHIPNTIVYQDNESTFLLAENGKTTKHLEVWYSFVTDKFKKGEVNVAFCPTHNMLADYFLTKSLQGTLFT